MPHFECGAFNHSATSPSADASGVECLTATFPSRKQIANCLDLHDNFPLFRLSAESKISGSASVTI